MLDGAEFNGRLFFPRSDVRPAPRGAVDSMVEVPGASLHLRRHGGGTGRTLLLFHGNGEVVSDYDDAAAAFARAGVDLAVVDFRGYGRSTGSPTLRAIIEDASCVLDAIVATKPGRLFVMGRSLGSTCANELYGRAPDAVHGFILESGSSDLTALVRRRGLPVPPLDDTARAIFDPLPKLARGRHPLLVLHGEHDTLILPEEADRAYETAGTTRKTRVFVRGRGHNDLSLSEEYWSSLAEFVQSLG